MIFLAVRNGRSRRRQPLDDEILDDEHAGRQPGRQPADVHRPLDEVGALALGALPQPRTEIDGEDVATSSTPVTTASRTAPARTTPAAAGGPARRSAAAACSEAVAASGSGTGSRWIVCAARSSDARQSTYSMTISTRPASTDVPSVTTDLLDAPGPGRPKLVLHLHRLDDDDGLAGGDLVARHRPAPGRRGPGIGATIDCSPVAWPRRRRLAAPRRPLTVTTAVRPSSVHQPLAGATGARATSTRGPWPCPRRRRG